MAILLNSLHEKFSQLVASGIQPAAAYRSLGYSSKGAPQSANKLRKRLTFEEGLTKSVRRPPSALLPRSPSINSGF